MHRLRHEAHHILLTHNGLADRAVDKRDRRRNVSHTAPTPRTPRTHVATPPYMVPGGGGGGGVVVWWVLLSPLWWCVVRGCPHVACLPWRSFIMLRNICVCACACKRTNMEHGTVWYSVATPTPLPTWYPTIPFGRGGYLHRTRDHLYLMPFGTSVSGWGILTV